MSPDDSRRDLALHPRSSGWRRFLGAPVWYLQMRLRWTQKAIDTIERQLAHEFAVVETAPLQAELTQLIAERDRLLARIA